jgi:hypothetical protein
MDCKLNTGGKEVIVVYFKPLHIYLNGLHNIIKNCVRICSYDWSTHIQYTNRNYNHSIPTDVTLDWTFSLCALTPWLSQDNAEKINEFEGIFISAIQILRVLCLEMNFPNVFTSKESIHIVHTTYTPYNIQSLFKLSWGQSFWIVLILKFYFRASSRK